MQSVRDGVDILFKIALAVAGAVTGYYFSFQKQQNEDVRLVIEMTTASEAPKRLMGASIAQSYFEQKRIPEPFYVAVYRYANSSPDQALQTTVNSGVAVTAQTDSGLKVAVDAAAKSLPARIYFHIRDEADRQPAAQIESAIEGAATGDIGRVIVPGIELIKGAQTKSLLKCFKPEDCGALGPALVQMFAAAGVTIELSDQSALVKNPTSIRPNHFEAWFAPGFANQ